MRSVPFQTKASLLLSLGGVAFICEIVKNQFHPQEPVLAVHRWSEIGLDRPGLAWYVLRSLILISILWSDFPFFVDDKGR